MICTKIVLTFILLEFWLVFVYIRYKGFWYTKFFHRFHLLCFIRVLKTIQRPYILYHKIHNLSIVLLNYFCKINFTFDRYDM